MPDDRVKHDESIAKDFAGRQIIYKPIIVIEHTADGKVAYHMHLEELDKEVKDPRIFGILLSDLVDQLAHAYHQATGRDVRDARDYLMMVMRDEDRFKQKDPSRGGQRAATIYPTKN